MDRWVTPASWLTLSCLGLSRRSLPAGSINRAGRKGAAVGAPRRRLSGKREGAVVALKEPSRYECAG
jgi:hypothetical protein